MQKYIDYAFKSKILKEHSDLLVKQKRASLYEHSLDRFINDGVILYALRSDKDGYEPYDNLISYCEQNGLMNELKECEKINHAYYERIKRLKNRVASILLNGACCFITLTFNDETLASTTEKQRRVAVSRYLKQYRCKYVANVDYGSKNKREHYHALINCEKVDFKSWRKFGNINAKRVRNKDIESDKSKLSKYIAKLSNHAIKETTKRSCLIYSR